MPELDYNVVFITGYHTITGKLDLKDRRLSDVLNDESHSAVDLHNVKVTRFKDPTKIVEQGASAAVCKDQIMLAFEPAMPAQSSKRLYGYVRKNQHKVFLLLEGIEVRGQIHTTGILDLSDMHRFITMERGRFVPVTQAVVTFSDDDHSVIQQDAVIINLQRLHYLGKSN